MLLFHGNGGTAADLDDASGLSELADRRGFLAVYPQGLSVGAGKPFWASSGRVDSASTSCASPPTCSTTSRRASAAPPTRCSPYGGRPASVASPLPLPALPTWLAEWATRDGCPGDPG